jgi:hypothetical protein
LQGVGDGWILGRPAGLDQAYIKALILAEARCQDAARTACAYDQKIVRIHPN